MHQPALADGKWLFVKPAEDGDHVGPAFAWNGLAGMNGVINIAGTLVLAYDDAAIVRPVVGNDLAAHTRPRLGGSGVNVGKKRVDVESAVGHIGFKPGSGAAPFDAQNDVSPNL